MWLKSPSMHGFCLCPLLCLLLCVHDSTEASEIPSAFLPKGYALDSVVAVNENTETVVSLTAAIPIPDANEQGGQLLWPIMVEESENNSALTVESAQLTIRGLYHESASDLTIRLLHEGNGAVLVQQRGEGRMYGFPTPRNYWDLSNLKQKRRLK